MAINPTHYSPNLRIFSHFPHSHKCDLTFGTDRVRHPIFKSSNHHILKFTTFSHFPHFSIIKFSNFHIITLFPSPPSKPVIPIGIKKQSEEDNHPGNLRIFQELVTGLPAGNHFVQREHNMASIQRRYR